MTMTSREIKETVDQLRRVAGRDTYTLANPSCLRFAYTAGERAYHGHTYTPVVREDDGILLYDTDHKEHLGFFPGDSDQHRRTRLLPCTNGCQYDVHGPENPDSERLYAEEEGTCTVIGPVEDR